MQDEKKLPVTYCSPEVIHKAEKLIERGTLISVFGKVSYNAIKENNFAKESYERLVTKGLKIFFNPTIPPETEVCISDKKYIYKFDRKKLIGSVEKSFSKGLKEQSKIEAFIENSIPIENFDAPVEELIEKFNSRTEIRL